MVSMGFRVRGVGISVPVGFVFNLKGSVMNYFVYNCHNEIVGNPKGYKTFRGAAWVEKRHKGALWRTFYAYRDNGGTDNTVSRISQGKE